jgi:hypothetical protein
MNSKISFEMRIIELNPWNHRLEPIHAICGVNDTGSSEDSPCPSEVANIELDMVKDILKENGIKFKSISVPTNNAFCIAKYIVVSEEDRYKALELIDHLLFETRLLYMCRRSHYKNQYEDDLPF